MIRNVLLCVENMIFVDNGEVAFNLQLSVIVSLFALKINIQVAKMSVKELLVVSLKGSLDESEQTTFNSDSLYFKWLSLYKCALFS